MPHPLILTLAFDPDTFARLDALRRRHFPPARNLVPAHVTLFHALPGGAEADIRDELRAVAAPHPPMPVRFPGVRSLGRGVAVTVEAPDLARLRGRLATAWVRWLTPQDRQPYRPHVTVQNKVTPAEARAVLDELAAGWEAFAGTGTGLLLWEYHGGPWELAEEVPFSG